MISETKYRFSFWIDKLIKQIPYEFDTCQQSRIEINQVKSKYICLFLCLFGQTGTVLDINKKGTVLNINETVTVLDINETGTVLNINEIGTVLDINELIDS